MHSSDQAAVTTSTLALDYVQLVERIGAGDESAEEALVAYFQPGIFSMLVARTHDRELALDLQQEALWEAIAALRRGQLREPLKLPGFVVAIARHRLHHYFRTKQQRPAMTVLPANLPAAKTSPDLEEESGRRVAVANALREISSNDRAILHAILVGGATPGQIAQKWGLSPEVVRKRKSRALRRIRKVVRRDS